MGPRRRFRIRCDLVDAGRRTGATQARSTPILRAESTWCGKDVASDAADDYFLLLNNDILVEPETVSRLLELAREKGPGVYGPKVLLQDRAGPIGRRLGANHLESRPLFLPGQGSPGPRAVRSRFGGCNCCWDAPCWSTGGCSRTWGSSTSGYFMYHEEVDFLFRAGRRGYPCYYCPAARVHHRRAHSTRDKPLQRVFWVRRNTVLFLRKHRVGTWRGVLGKTLVLSLVWNIVLLRWQRVAAIWRGVVAGMRQEWGTGGGTS